MRNLSALLATLMVIVGCGGGGDKPKPPDPKPRVMSFTIKGSTMLIKAKLKDSAKYDGAELKKAMLTDLAPLDNK